VYIKVLFYWFIYPPVSDVSVTLYNMLFYNRRSIQVGVSILKWIKIIRILLSSRFSEVVCVRAQRTLLATTGAVNSINFRRQDFAAPIAVRRNRVELNWEIRYGAQRAPDWTTHKSHRRRRILWSHSKTVLQVAVTTYERVGLTYSHLCYRVIILGKHSFFRKHFYKYVFIST